MSANVELLSNGKEADAKYPERRNNHSDNFLLRGSLSDVDEKGYNIESPAPRAY